MRHVIVCFQVYEDILMEVNAFMRCGYITLIGVCLFLQVHGSRDPG